MDTPSYRLSVLLADDDIDDRLLFQDAVEEIQLKVHLQIVDDGEALMHYLTDAAIILPDLLFLDLNMPFKNGFQCLETIRKNRMLEDVFIIIYSTTANPRDIEQAYTQGANLFVHKPNSYIELKHILARVFTLHREGHFISVQKESFVFTCK